MSECSRMKEKTSALDAGCNPLLHTRVCHCNRRQGWQDRSFMFYATVRNGKEKDTKRYGYTTTASFF